MARPSTMRLEIEEQPATLDRTFRDLRQPAAEARAMIDARRSVLFFARGTSDHATTFGRYLFEIVGGRCTSSGSPSVATLYGATLDLSDTTAIFVSQSGHTAELIETAAWARRCGAATVAVSNTAGSPLVDVCDLALVTSAGPEHAVPATKTHTAQLLAMAMLTSPQWDDELAALGATIFDLLERLAELPSLEEATSLLAASHAIVCVGRGFSLASAQESALKLEETTGQVCLGLSAADFQHGPMAVLGARTPLLTFVPPDGPCVTGLEQVEVLAQQRGSPVVRVGGSSVHGTCHIPAGELSEELSPIGLSIVGQVLAERTARARGVDCDEPHGLTKVTQTLQ